MRLTRHFTVSDISIEPKFTFKQDFISSFTLIFVYLLRGRPRKGWDCLFLLLLLFIFINYELQYNRIRDGFVLSWLIRGVVGLSGSCLHKYKKKKFCNFSQVKCRFFLIHVRKFTCIDNHEFDTPRDFFKNDVLNKKVHSII